MLVAGVATVECFDRLSTRHTVVAAIGGIAAAAPGVVAQARNIFLGVAGVGRQAALVVGEGVVHGLSVVRCGKDSEKSRRSIQVMQIFCHAVFAYGLVELGEVAFRAALAAVGHLLPHALVVVILNYNTLKAAAKRDGCFKPSDS